MIKGTTVYVPLSVDQKVMASVMRTHAFEHVKTRFAPGAEIAAELDAREVRLLFAGVDATPHHHHGERDQARSSGHDHGHHHGDEGHHGRGHPHDHDHSHRHGQTQVN